MKSAGWLLSLLTMVAWNSFAMTVSLQNETTAHVVLNETELKVTQTQAGAWRLQQLVEGRADELGAAQVLEGRCWTVPTIHNGRLYVRNLEKLVCLDLRK